MDYPFRIPVRTAVALRGDFWTCGLAINDPRGHRNTREETPDFREYRAALRFRRLADEGQKPAQIIARVSLVSVNL